MKTRIILLVTFGLFLTLTSCSKDSPKDLIIGKWRLSEVSGPGEEDYEDCDFTGYIQFKSDGKFMSIDDCTEETETGLYSVEDNRLTVIADELPIPFVLEILVLNDETLRTEFQGDISTFTRI
jgi:hypothetical protein